MSQEFILIRKMFAFSIKLLILHIQIQKIERTSIDDHQPDNGQWSKARHSSPALRIRALAVSVNLRRSHLHCRYLVDPLVVSHVSHDHSNLILLQCDT